MPRASDDKTGKYSSERHNYFKFFCDDCGRQIKLDGGEWEHSECAPGVVYYGKGV